MKTDGLAVWRCNETSIVCKLSPFHVKYSIVSPKTTKKGFNDKFFWFFLRFHLQTLAELNFDLCFHSQMGKLNGWLSPCYNVNGSNNGAFFISQKYQTSVSLIQVIKLCIEIYLDPSMHHRTIYASGDFVSYHWVTGYDIYKTTCSSCTYQNQQNHVAWLLKMSLNIINKWQLQEVNFRPFEAFVSAWFGVHATHKISASLTLLSLYTIS